MGHRRREGVHHQLGHADHVDHHGHRPHRRRARSAPSSCPRARPGSSSSRRTARWAGTRRTPTGCSSTTAGCRRTTCSASEGAGFRQFLAILDDGRVAIAALAVGLAQACLEHSVAYAKERQAFGGPIGRNQAVAFKCADLAVMVENARALTYKAAWLKDNGRPFKQAAAMAKLYATEAAVTATREATQIFGGYGFIDETPVSRFYRDAKILEIGEGTSEIQRLVIAASSASPSLDLPVDADDWQVRW